jgi:hypothetical protein
MMMMMVVVVADDDFWGQGRQSKREREMRIK